MTKILFVGDTHADEHSVVLANNLAFQQECDLIFQVGDFGYTFDRKPQDKRFMEAVEHAPVPWWFIRGNHDDTEWLKEASGMDCLYGEEIVEARPNMFWVPDLCRVEIDGVSFACLGGAFSIDKSLRTAWISYWPDENPSLAHGDIKQADVLVSHDTPDSLWSLVQPYCLSDLPIKLEMQSKQSRLIVEDYFQFVEPKIVVHGHYHAGYKAKKNGVAVVGLDCNGADGFAWIFDTEYFNDNRS